MLPCSTFKNMSLPLHYRDVTDYPCGNEPCEVLSSRSFSVVEEQVQHGPYNWLAPEILSGAGPTEKSDLYSLCAVMWEIIHGQCTCMRACAWVRACVHACMRGACVCVFRYGLGIVQNTHVCCVLVLMLSYRFIWPKCMEEYVFSSIVQARK